MHIRRSLRRSHGGARPEDERAVWFANGVWDDCGEFGGGSFCVDDDHGAGGVRWGGAESSEVFGAGGVERGAIVGGALGVLGGAVCGLCGLLWIFEEFAEWGVGWSERRDWDFEDGRRLLAAAAAPKVEGKC